MKKNTKHIASFMCSLALLLTGVTPLTVSATTVSDVIAHAYAVGLPEATIQQCINTYSNGTYTSEQCDKAIAMLDSWAAKRDDAIAGEDTSSNNSKPSSSSSANNSKPSSNSSTNSSKPSSNSSTNSSKPSSNSSTDSSKPSSTDSNNSSSDSSAGVIVDNNSNNNNPNSNGSGLISNSEFDKMNIDEKKQYIASLDSEEKTVFIQNMTSDQKNDFLKNLDVTQQADIMAEFVGFGEAFGLTLSVDEISDDAIMISARDENGNLVDVTTFGNAVEATGIPYTIPIVLGGSAIILSVSALIWLLRKSY